MLKVLYGMLAGYLVASFEMSLILTKKGYESLQEVPDKERLDK
jgi:hypothetical protein